MSRSKRRRLAISRSPSTASRSPFGRLSAEAADRARDLRAGLPLSLFTAPKRGADQEVRCARSASRRARADRISPRDIPRRRLTRSSSSRSFRIIGRGCRGCATPIRSFSRALPICGGAPMSWFWNRRAPAPCSRSAIRRSLRSLAALATPQMVKTLRRQPGFPGLDLLALLLDGQILFKVSAKDKGLRPSEGDGNLVLWDFHDLLFHARSTEGRHANLVGGVYSYMDVVEPQPAVRPSWPGEKIDLRRFPAAAAGRSRPAAKALQGTALDARLRRPRADHACRTVAVSRQRRAHLMRQSKRRLTRNRIPPAAARR